MSTLKNGRGVIFGSYYQDTLIEKSAWSLLGPIFVVLFHLWSKIMLLSVFLTGCLIHLTKYEIKIKLHTALFTPHMTNLMIFFIKVPCFRIIFHFSRIIPKTQKMVLGAALLNTKHYKVRIKGKVEQSRERSNTLSYTLV